MGMLKALVGSRLPPRYHKYFDLPPRQESRKIGNTAATALGRACSGWLEFQPERSAVYRLDSGLEALDARIGLIKYAEKSIDIQSYLLRDDQSGNRIVLDLVAAAGRGVRVRMLMDDALTEPIDAGLMAINEHPNIEIRVFNPFPRRRSRLVSFIANFNILNRRMHNKSFTVDNQVTIVGGRNLADEYFQTGGENEFVDEDLLAIGAVVDEVSDGFDLYWNTSEAIPINVFGAVDGRLSIDQAIAEGQRLLREHADTPLVGQVGMRLVEKLLSKSLSLIAADTRLVMDHPERARRVLRRQPSETTKYLQKIVSAAVREVIIVSPYFVPQMQGIDFFAALVRKGVRVCVVTNSLASTNHISVHAVYARYRKPLLRQGIELYELAPQFRRGGQAAHNATTRLTLHSKVAVIDRELTFVGSFNLDPRSLYINTEMGVVVESANLASTMAQSIIGSLSESAYRLYLGRSGGLRWSYRDGQDEHVMKTEPETGFLRRMSTRLMSLLPIEGQM